MFYIIEGENIHIYSVEIDKEKLLKLRLKIINESSIVEHKCYKTDLWGIPKSSEWNRNLQSKLTGGWIRKIHDMGEYFEEEYEVSYDEYTYPEIVYTIDKILRGNYMLINKLHNMNIQDNIYINEILECINISSYKTVNLLDIKDIFSCLEPLDYLHVNNKYREIVKEVINNGRVKVLEHN